MLRYDRSDAIGGRTIHDLHHLLNVLCHLFLRSYPAIWPCPRIVPHHVGVVHYWLLSLPPRSTISSKCVRYSYGNRPSQEHVRHGGKYQTIVQGQRARATRSKGRKGNIASGARATRQTRCEDTEHDVDYDSVWIDHLPWWLCHLEPG